MNYGPLLFLGFFLTLASSWCGLVLIPQLQLGSLQPVKIEATGELYPAERPGLAQQGESVYRAEGCIYCHSRQVRRKGYGKDIERNWGQRGSVARDYIRDRTVMLGTMRTGPDLTNIGARQPSASWHLLHLYNPQLTSPGSIMPPHPFLFELRPLKGRPLPEALSVTNIPAGYQLVPKPAANALVAYLLSLKTSPDVPEAK